MLDVEMLQPVTPFFSFLFCPFFSLLRHQLRLLLLADEGHCARYVRHSWHSRRRLPAFLLLQPLRHHTNGNRNTKESTDFDRRSAYLFYYCCYCVLNISVLLSFSW